MRAAVRVVIAAMLWSATSARAAGEPRADTRPTVAVLYFDYSGKDEGLVVLRKGLAQMLISDLSGMPAVRIVERDRLQEVLDEIKLGQSAKIDPASAAKAGKLLGARYMVLGSYFDLMGTLRADARVVEVETGRVLRSTGASGKPDDFLSVEQKLSNDLAGVLGAQLPAEPKPPSETKAPVETPRQHPKPPAHLKTRTALAYSKALDAIDHKDKAQAKQQLQQVVKEQPDFALASLDLDRLMQ
jgi:TolB-like protein